MHIKKYWEKMFVEWKPEDLWWGETEALPDSLEILSTFIYMSSQFPDLITHFILLFLMSAL